MRIKITILLILISLAGRSQNDTIIYLSNLERILPSKENATYYYEINKDKRDGFALKEYKLKDNKWNVIYESIILKASDSSYISYTPNNKKQQYLRIFTKSENGYYVKDYSGSKLLEEGYTQLIFPTIKNGPWKKYNADGKIKEEGQYKNNQLLTNKYLIPSGSYIKDVFIHVDKLAKYEGGDENLLRFIAENTNYPVSARDNNITGTVIVSFILSKDGTIQGIDFYKRVHYLLELESLRVINSIPNKWEPAEINGQKVNTVMMIPITFSLK